MVYIFHFQIFYSILFPCLFQCLPNQNIYLSSANDITLNQKFEVINSSLDAIGMTKESQKNVYRFLAVILNISNIDFDESESNGALSISDSSMKFLKNVAALINADLSELKQNLLMRTMTVCGDKIP